MKVRKNTHSCPGIVSNMSILLILLITGVSSSMDIATYIYFYKKK